VSPSSESNSITIDRCDPAAERNVLALAARAWPESERAAYWQAIKGNLAAGNSRSIILLAARDAERLLAAQVGQVMAGKAAVVWQSAIEVGDSLQRASIARQLFTRMTHELAGEGACLAQSLLAPSDDQGAALFSLGGFQRAAELLYLAADVAGTGETSQMPAEFPFQMQSFSDVDEARLPALIERTYLGTLDCPMLDGLRPTRDVLAGYKSIGQFDPTLWQIVRHGGVDVACLLLNVHPDVQHAEIVYVGLIPEVRGRGWGYLLARWAQSLAHERDCTRIVLAVDANNQPAINMYSRADFFEFDRRVVWIRALSTNDSSATT